MSSDEESLWYKDAIIYELHVRCFFDNDGDGVGDFQGLTKKLDYLQDLGITAIWLLPFYPSPLKDDGYDIADYLNIHPNYGTLHDFKIFLREAHTRGLKVIIELIINHTSDQHPWFQRARQAKPNSRYRNYYVWSDSPEKYKDARIIFQDFESSNWTWDPVAKSYFWHRFYSHQPDLNFENVEVQQAIYKILSFWLKMGVDAVRLDAIPYLFEKEGTNCENLFETHQYLKNLRTFVDSHFKNRMLLAEANQWPEDAAKYFGEGNECHMAFHFPVMPRLFMAIHLEDALPIIEIMGQTPPIPDNCQWALFLRNHDELTLEMVTDEERDYMFRVYAHDPQARINLGIRHRLAPLLKNDRRKIELMNSLLYSLTGTPVLYYGDEIGMGDNIYLGDRNGVRTPMQWSNDRNAGFSRANPQALYLPPIIDPEYHFETVNVEAQMKNPHSLLWWTKQLIALRKKFKVLGQGMTHFLSPENRKVLVFVREYQSDLILIVSNLSRFPQYVELDLSQYKGFHPIELFSGEQFPAIGELPYFLTLGPYGYYWFALQREPTKTPLENWEREREKKVLSLMIKKEGKQLFSSQNRKTLDVAIRSYLFKRAWFQKPFESIDRTKSKIVDLFIISSSIYGHIYLIILQLGFTNGIIERYPIFLTLLKEETAKKALNESPERVLAKLKHEENDEREWVLFDVSEEYEPSEIFLKMIENQHRLKGEEGEIQGISYAHLREKSFFLSLGKEKGIVREGEHIFFYQMNETLRILGSVEEGMDPDVEFRLMLQSKTSFRAFLPLLGYLKYRCAGQPSVALAVDSAPFTPEFTAKAMMIEQAEHFLLKLGSEKAMLPDTFFLPKATLGNLATQSIAAEWLPFFQGAPGIAMQLGEMTADLHLALSSIVDDRDFIPIFYTLFYQRSLYQSLRKQFLEGYEILQRKGRLHISDHLKEEVIKAAATQKNVMKFLSIFPYQKISGQRLRIHGDYTLDNLLYVGKQFLISNFSGNLQLTYSSRKYKKSPLSDVTSMIFSIAEAGFMAAAKLQERGVLTSDSKNLVKEAGGWALWISSIFLRAYFEKIGKGMLFSSKEVNDYLIGVFLLEKCFSKISEEEKKKTSSLETALFLIQAVESVYKEGEN